MKWEDILITFKHCDMTFGLSTDLYLIEKLDRKCYVSFSTPETELLSFNLQQNSANFLAMITNETWSKKIIYIDQLSSPLYISWWRWFFLGVLLN